MVKRVCGSIVDDEIGHHLPKGGAMLESVTRATAEDPDILVGGMPVDDEVMVGCVFVLADSAFEQRRVLHSREAMSEITARGGASIFADQSLSPGWIELLAARIVG